MRAEVELAGRYLDRDMDAEETRVFEKRMAREPALARLVRDLEKQSEALRNAVPDPSPDHIVGLMAAARQSAKRPLHPVRRIAAAAALFAAGLGGGYEIAASRFEARLTAFLDSPNEVTREAAFAHALYSVEIRHPVEVPGAERDHLGAWLSNRLGAEISAPDLTDTGLALVGGRLLPFNGGAAAQFMYERSNGERITLFATTTNEPVVEGFHFAETDGLGTVYWQKGIWRYAIVGDGERAELERLARRVYGELT